VSCVGFGFVDFFFGRVVWGFWWVCWFGVLLEQVWVSDGGFNCFLGLGFTWVLGVVGAFWPRGFDRSFCCFWVLGL
jgi:hypothetical protein